MGDKKKKDKKDKGDKGDKKDKKEKKEKKGDKKEKKGKWVRLDRSSEFFTLLGISLKNVPHLNRFTWCTKSTWFA